MAEETKQFDQKAFDDAMKAAETNYTSLKAEFDKVKTGNETDVKGLSDKLTAVQDILDTFLSERQDNPACGIVQAIVLFDEYRGKGLENRLVGFQCESGRQAADFF